MEEFDKVAGRYQQEVEEGMILRGNSHRDFQRYKMQYLKETIPQDYTGKILDYGCGVGTLTEVMQETFPQAILHGFDISSESIAHIPARLRHGQNRFTSRYEELDQDYAFAVASTVLHHVPLKERIEVVKKIYHLLCPGGLLFLIEHNMKNPLTRRSVNACPFDQGAVMLTLQESRNLLQQAGFREVHSRYITFFPLAFARLRFFDKFLGWLPLGAQYLIIGKR